MGKLPFVPVLAALVFAPAADAVSKKRHRVNVHATVMAHAVSPTGEPIVGALSDPVLGSGAAVYKTSGRSPANGTILENLTFQVWSDVGSIKGTGTLRVTPAANGAPTTFTGSGTITRGTGRYKGAKGTLTFTGSFDSANDANGTITGSFAY